MKIKLVIFYFLRINATAGTANSLIIGILVKKWSLR